MRIGESFSGKISLKRFGNIASISYVFVFPFQPTSKLLSHNMIPTWNTPGKTDPTVIQRLRGPPLSLISPERRSQSACYKAALFLLGPTRHVTRERKCMRRPRQTDGRTDGRTHKNSLKCSVRRAWRIFVCFLLVNGFLLLILNQEVPY